MKIKKIIVSILIIIVISLAVYFVSFYPKNDVTAINSNISFDDKVILNKFFPNNFKFSLKEISAESNVLFNEEELTDIFIMLSKQIPDLNEKVQGLKICLEDNKIKLYSHVKLKGIPLEPILTFTCLEKENQIVFHYEKGEIGFLSISYNMIFDNLKDTSVIKLDKDNNDIILSLEDLKHIDVESISIEDNTLKISVKGSLKLFD